MRFRVGELVKRKSDEIDPYWRSVCRSKGPFEAAYKIQRIDSRGDNLWLEGFLGSVMAHKFEHVKMNCKIEDFL